MKRTDMFGNIYEEDTRRSRRIPSSSVPKPENKEEAEKPKARPEWAIRKPNKLYFVHRQYKGCDAHPPLVFEYVGKMKYFDGSIVKEFVHVRCINDLGLRAYLAGAYTTEAKRMLSPYKGELPDPWYRPPVIPTKQVLAPAQRINKGLSVSAKRGR